MHNEAEATISCFKLFSSCTEKTTTIWNLKLQILTNWILHKCPRSRGFWSDPMSHPLCQNSWSMSFDPTDLQSVIQKLHWSMLRFEAWFHPSDKLDHPLTKNKKKGSSTNPTWWSIATSFILHISEPWPQGGGIKHYRLLSEWGRGNVILSKMLVKFCPSWSCKSHKTMNIKFAFQKKIFMSKAVWRPPANFAPDSFFDLWSN
jgi:hypothetical protein